MLCPCRAALHANASLPPCLQTLQRRCYWMLEGDGDIVLVHYLVAGQGSRIRATTAAQNAAAAQVCAEALSELGKALNKGARGRVKKGVCGDIHLCFLQCGLAAMHAMVLRWPSDLSAWITPRAPLTSLHHVIGCPSCTAARQVNSISVCNLLQGHG